MLFFSLCCRAGSPTCLTHYPKQFHLFSHGVVPKVSGGLDFFGLKYMTGKREGLGSAFGQKTCPLGKVIKAGRAPTYNAAINRLLQNRSASLPKPLARTVASHRKTVPPPPSDQASSSSSALTPALTPPVPKPPAETRKPVWSLYDQPPKQKKHKRHRTPKG